ncbi:MAG: 16S rRNA (cytosine(967)-C(5))-methyltransferase RsmB, partial [Syntrophomonadaceae bacterium]|nr:16S rRNA (cytosine(967)-C(5))-methyltransferase RsmB [Syntrophomonadaceae bacterium]
AMNKKNREKHSNLSARRLAVKILMRILYQGAYANLALDQGLKNSNLSERDRGLVTEIVNGTIRMKKHLEWVLNIFLIRKKTEFHSHVHVVLISALYQMLFLERIPAYAIINEAVEMTRGHGSGATGLVNGLLRNVERNREKIEFPDSQRQPIEYLATYYSHPEWMVSRWLERYGWEQTEKLLIFNNQPPSLAIRINRMRVGQSQLMSIFDEEEVIYRPGRLPDTCLVLDSLPVPLFRLGSYRQGLYYVQSEASMLIPLVLNPDPGSLVYDLCSGVGGKTSHLAELMEDKGRIVAVDLHQHKIDLLKIHCKRMGINIVESRVGDVIAMLPGFARGDSVLLDVPCSGSGVLRSRTDIRWRRNEEDIKAMATLQSQMLEAVADKVRKGGQLVYSTCSLEPEENEQVIEKFLTEHPDYKTLNVGEALTGRLDSMGNEQDWLTIFPPHHGMDGMFICLLRRQ